MAEFLHVLNRGVDKRKVFLESADYARFIHDMYEFNDKRNAPEYGRRSDEASRRREKLVDIHAFCLMPNHYHFLLSELQDDGISLFMRKLNMGYSKYFNAKYERSGVLWQGVFKKILITRDAHFLYIPYYIHLNPLDLKFPEWRSGDIRDVKAALEFLDSYRWSSYQDYVGMRNFPSVFSEKELSPMLGSAKRQRAEIVSIIQNAPLAAASEAIEI